MGTVRAKDPRQKVGDRELKREGVPEDEKELHRRAMEQEWGSWLFCFRACARALAGRKRDGEAD
eukprot:8219015-Lingulodinium_polyedra.AAC.1